MPTNKEDALREYSFIFEMADGQKINFDNVTLFTDNDYSNERIYGMEDIKEKYKVERPTEKWTKQELLEYIEKQFTVIDNREKQLQEQKSRNLYDRELLELKHELFGIKQTTSWVKEILALLGDIQNGRGE